jgi:hypothetical protein
VYALRSLWQHSEEIAYDAEICDFKEWGFWIFIDHNDCLTGLHTCAMLNRSRNSTCNV